MAPVYKVAAGAYVPGTFPCSKNTLVPTTKCAMPGFDAEILAYAMDTVGAAYELVPFQEPVNLGTYENGTWTGVLGLIHNGTMDTTSTNFIQVPVRNVHFEFSYPIMQDEAVFLVHQPTQSFWASSAYVFRVFKLELWGCIIACVIASLIAMQFTRAFSHGQLNLTWDSFRMFLNQTASTTVHRFAGSNMLTVWLGLISVFSFNLYQGCLSTRFLHPPLPPPFSGFQQIIDLLRSGELQVLADSPGFWYIEEMRTSDNYMYTTLREITKQNPIRFEPNFTKALELVKTGQYIWPVSSTTAYWLASMHCSFAVVTDSSQPRKWRSYVFKRNHPLVPAFNRAMIKIQEMAATIRAKYATPRTFCNVYGGERSSGWAPLSTFSLSGVMVLILLGGAVGAGLLYMEKVQKKMEDKHVEESFTKMRKLTVSYIQDAAVSMGVKRARSYSR